MIGSPESNANFRKAATEQSAAPPKAKRRMVSIDGNTAVAHVAHATNEVIAIYPITPSSVMGEIADAKSAKGEKNIWGTIPTGHRNAVGRRRFRRLPRCVDLRRLDDDVYGLTGIAADDPEYVQDRRRIDADRHSCLGARSLAIQALSIFGDHSDVMACRSTGFGMIASGSVQEVMDNALIAQAIALRSRIPFLHFFDGFRTSHEVAKVEELTFDDMRQMIPDELVFEHRHRALTPDRPVLRGTSQNPDVYFQGREVVNNFLSESNYRSASR